MSFVKNMSVCGTGSSLDIEDVCLDKPTEQLSIFIAVIVLLTNGVHFSCLLQLRTQRVTVFYTTLQASAILDLCTPVSLILHTTCGVRLFTVIQHPSLCILVTIAGSTVLYLKNLIIVFTFVERWLILAQPFQYSNNIFIKRYNVWICFAAICSFVLSVTTYMFPYFYESEVCFDSGYGALGVQSDTYYIVLFPLFVVSVALILFSLLFFHEYLKMRRRHILTEEDTITRHACEYVLASTIAYTVWACLAILIFILAEVGQNLKPWVLIIIPVHGMWNIIALYIWLKSYRDKIKNLLKKCLQRGAVLNRVHPTI